MKKTIIAALSALALLAPTAMRADEPAKEYNMVITLQNGTTITLGHNDIKNITFNGEEISISGNAANTIQDLEAETRRLKEDLANVVYSLEDYAKIAFVFTHIDELRSLIDTEDANLRVHITALEDYVHQNRGDIESLKAYADEVMYRTEMVTDRTNAIEQAVVNSEEKITNLEMRNDYQDAYIADLKGKIDSLNQMVNELYKKLEEK